MSRASRNTGVRAVAVLAITSSLLISGAALAQAAPPSPVGSLDFGSLDFGSSQEVADAPRLVGIDNFRDVAGTGSGYSGSFGQHVNKGVFYRANAITPKGADMAALESLGLTKVYDLRTAAEIADKPDVLPAGVAYENIPVLAGDIYQMAFQIKSPEEARSLMQDANRSFVTGAAERAGFTQLLTALAETDGPQVFHCTAGKDRTGWASMLLLSIAGVDRATIMSDYLLTNEYSTESIKATLAYISSVAGPAVATNMEPLLGVEAGYIEAGLDQVESSYGTIDRYLTEGLGLSLSTIGALKAKLLG
ncbi:tyrosine-protein phosphatase [Rhodococcus sp. 24CO]|uniref:tyrosine-protein phosphatase n=1 Tax=Rhodococcus sp. 24CO TaxID=3117460 RepID=UPI003D3263A8